MKTNFDIDFIVPWVDGSDPQWIEEFNKYCPEDKRILDVREERYRDNGLLKYWFRGIEKFAPWVRKVHFVTCGQKPEWLNLNAPTLHWVKHEDYIPREYLPVFSSHPIELIMHKIPDLAEHFVYFNDDVFLTAPIKETFFFKNGLPCDSAILGTIGVSTIKHILFNDNNLINSHFNKAEVIKEHFAKWINLKYGIHLIRTLCLLPFSGFSGFYNPHFASPYTKSLLEEVWGKFPDKLTQTMQNRFRSEQDVNQYLFQDYRFCTGEFYPIHPNKSKMCFNLNDNIETISTSIKKQKYKQIVLNDCDCEDFDLKIKEINSAFESILPEKSTFEL